MNEFVMINASLFRLKLSELYVGVIGNTQHCSGLILQRFKQYCIIVVMIHQRTLQVKIVIMIFVIGQYSHICEYLAAFGTA